MKEHLFLYKDGDAFEVKPKPFCFELAMEGYISDNPNVLSNERLDLLNPEIKGYELSPDSLRRMDLLLEYANDTVAIVELKNVVVKDCALNQLDDYLKAFPKTNNDDEAPLIGLLVGPEIEESVLQRIANDRSLHFPIFGVELNRYFDNGQWLVFTRWYVPQAWNKGKRDYSKYVINNGQQFLGKGRLVFEVIKDYLTKHPETTISELQVAFPGFLRTNASGNTHLNVVDNEETVKAEDRYRRYFKDALPCSDGQVVVSSQWGRGNINAFIAHARKMGYVISTIKL